MPFLLTLAKLLCAWLMGCFALVAAAAASAFVCGGSRMNDATGARSIKKKGKAPQAPAGMKERKGGSKRSIIYFLLTYVTLGNHISLAHQKKSRTYSSR